MGFKITTRNWDYAGKLFQFTIPEGLEENINDVIEQVQDIYSQSILELLESQPGDWTPKTEDWAKRSGSKDLFYGEEGQFVISVTENNRRGLRAKKGDKKIFVGARHDVKHHSGYSMETLAEILQSVPDGSRNLFGRAYERVEDRINSTFKNINIIPK